MQPCIQERRIKKLEDNQVDSSADINNLTTTVEKVILKVDMLIKVLLFIAAKVSVGLLLILGYFIKTIIER